MAKLDVETLADRLLAGEKLALSRGISLVEDGTADGQALLRAIYPHTGKAWIIGVTGAPGAGKSTLVSALARLWSRAGKRVGVVAVDPSSPFTGGALLGDRIRLQMPRRGEPDGDLFFRSLASRGQTGGLSRATGDTLRLMDAAGREIILLETVGAGQAEVAVMHLAHTVTVVLVPGLGDEVQAIKAGILEIGDLFIVNKADREGANRVLRELNLMLHSGMSLRGTHGEHYWQPPVIKTVAQTGEGVEELALKLEQHRQFLQTHGLWRELARRQEEERMQTWLRLLAVDRIERTLRGGSLWKTMVERLERRTVDPYSAAKELLAAAWPEEAEV